MLQLGVVGVEPLEELGSLVSLRAQVAPFKSVRSKPKEFIDAGEHVVTPFTNHARGRDGIDLQARGTVVWTIRNGVIVRACLCQERQEALEAAGLRE